MKPGTPRKATRDFKEYARQVLESPKQIEADLREMARHPSSPLAMFYRYHVYGKPKETIEVTEGLAERLQRALGRGARGDQST